MKLSAIAVAIIAAGVLLMPLHVGAGVTRTSNQIRPLTDGEKAQARAIVSGDAALARALARAGFSVSEIVPWYTTDYQPIGAGVRLDLAEPSPVVGAVPMLEQEGLAPGEKYRSRVRDVLVNRVTEIYAMVDLGESRLAGVYLAGPQIEYVRPREEPARQTRSIPDRAAPYPPVDGGGFGYIQSDGYNQFYNWDMTSQSLAPDNADWPSTLVFGNNATINKVKDGLNGQGYGNSGSTMFGFVTAGTGACCVWDADDGRKTGICSGTHYRVYADSDDRMYTPSWGYFVMGTTHRDNDECPGGAGPTHGWSEEAEDNVQGASSAAGWAIYPDYLAFNNSVVTSWIGNRYYQNNGWATLITVP